MEKFVTISDCEQFCKFIGYEISNKGLRTAIDRNIVNKKRNTNNAVLIDREEFVKYILESKNKKKRKVKKKNNVSKDLSSNDIYYNLNIGIDWFQCTFYERLILKNQML